MENPSETARTLAEKHAQRLVLIDELSALAAVLGIKLTISQRGRLSDYRRAVVEQHDAAVKLAEADWRASTHAKNTLPPIPDPVNKGD